MGKMICDDRKSPEEYRKEREFIQSMSDKEFDDYIKKMKKKRKITRKPSSNRRFFQYDTPKMVYRSTKKAT